MPKSPFYSVQIRDSGFNLTEFITSFDYEDSVSKDNTLDLQLKTNNTDLIDRRGLVEGVILSFRFGFLRGAQSTTRFARVANINADFGNDIRIRLKATDLGIAAKKNTSDRIWEKVTASTIARQIATKYGLTPIVDDTTIVYPSIPQGNKTDYNFLKELAMGEANGSYRFFIRGNQLHFNRRNLNQASIKTFKWQRGDGGLISFSPSSKETAKSGASKETTVLGMNAGIPDVQTSVTNTTAQDDTKLDNYAVHFNNDGERVTPSPSQSQAVTNDPNSTGEKFVVPNKTPQNGLNMANKIKKDVALKDLSATAKIEMDPAIEADQIATFENVSNKFSGNWYIQTVRYKIGGGFASSTLTLNRNAQSRPLEDNQQALVTNKVSGPDDTSVKKEVAQVNFDNDGNRVEI